MNDVTIIRQFYLACLSQASYLVIDKASRECVVVDPLRDIDQYLVAADDAGATIVGVINTHVHADFVSGNQELRQRTGAWIAMGSEAATDYDILRLDDEESIQLGHTRLRFWHTPGHTPESTSVLVESGREVCAVLTGDTLFIGDVGRPDLVAASDARMSAEEMARALFHSVQRLLTLPDPVLVYPAHGAGSSCGKNLSTETVSTIGAQRRDNHMLNRRSMDDFIDEVTSGQPATPAYFSVNALMNKTRREAIFFDSIRPLMPDELESARLAGAVIVDVRDPDSFADGHLAGALNIGVDGRLAETAGMLITFGAPLIIAADSAETAHEARTRLARVGLDDVRGYQVMPVSGDLRRSERITAARLAAEPRAGSVILDVRGPAEVDAAGCLPGAINVALPTLPRWLASQHNRDRVREYGAVVYCAGGWRSSVAASYLRAETGARIRDVVGGFTAISALSQEA